jgi:preprotein translocase subunit SecB
MQVGSVEHVAFIGCPYCAAKIAALGGRANLPAVVRDPVDFEAFPRLAAALFSVTAPFRGVFELLVLYV